jgi:hypothetical protein
MDSETTPQAGASPAEPKTLTEAMHLVADEAAAEGRSYLNGADLQEAALTRWPHLATHP